MKHVYSYSDHDDENYEYIEVYILKNINKDEIINEIKNKLDKLPLDKLLAIYNRID